MDARHPSATPAAAVVVHRDRSADAEILLVRRRAALPDRDPIPFAGQWVVPGGQIGPEDHQDDHVGAVDVARRAAVRELEEETGIVVSPADLGELWDLDSETPTGRHFHISYFEAWLPSGQRARPDGIELDRCRWVRPAVAHAEALAGRVDVPPATLETLRRLGGTRPPTASELPD